MLEMVYSTLDIDSLEQQVRSCLYLLFTFCFAPAGQTALGARWFRPPAPVWADQDPERQRSHSQWDKVKGA